MQKLKSDPKPWISTCGVRASKPGADGAPQGGYTFSPREGYADYPDRYISTSKPTERADAWRMKQAQEAGA